MSSETDLWDSLTGDATLAALIGTRLYRSRAEEDPTVPYIVCFEVHDKPSQVMTGAITVDRPVYQYMILADTDDETIAIRNALRGALVASGYPVLFEDDRSTSDVLSALRRRDLTVRVSFGL
jgi:hypothetical protein